MSKINDGGPAFPRPHSTDEHEFPCNEYDDQQGMMLRDWFAGQAKTFESDEVPAFWAAYLAGIPNPSYETDGTQQKEWAEWWIKAEACYKYKQADAMIAARGAS